MTTQRIGRRAMLVAAGAAGFTAAAPLAAGAAESWRARKRFVDVFGRRMAYVEVGTGRPVVFLHGNPTSSYLWRNIIPHVERLGRCIAPDMIGMGDSENLPNSGPGVYSYATHRKFMFELLRKLGADRGVVFVIHDWGSALGFDFASHNPAAVRGIAYSEAILWNGPPPQAQAGGGGGLFDRFQTQEGERLILEQNLFVEQLLIGGLKYYLTLADGAEYRRPFLTPGESRRPTLEWPRELPAYSPANAAIAQAYTSWLKGATRTPKLFLHALPGAILANPSLLALVRSFPNQREVTVYGNHYVQEISPDAIGRALAEWITSLG